MAPFFTSPRVFPRQTPRVCGGGRVEGPGEFRAVAKMCECRSPARGGRDARGRISHASPRALTRIKVATAQAR